MFKQSWVLLRSTLSASALFSEEFHLFLWLFKLICLLFGKSRLRCWLLITKTRSVTEFITLYRWYKLLIPHRRGIRRTLMLGKLAWRDYHLIVHLLDRDRFHIGMFLLTYQRLGSHLLALFRHVIILLECLAWNYRSCDVWRGYFPQMINALFNTCCARSAFRGHLEIVPREKFIVIRQLRLVVLNALTLDRSELAWVMWWVIVVDGQKETACAWA